MYRPSVLRGVTASSLRTVGLSAVLLLRVLSAAGGAGSNSKSAVPAPPVRAPALSLLPELSDAGASLASGAGPAGGVALACQPTEGGSADCSSAAASAPGAPSLGWANLTGRQSSSPPARSYGRSLAYDPSDGYVLLFGGYTSAGYLGDTWKFQHGEWTKLNPSPAPSGRDHSSLVWDAPAGYLLLFGGSNSGGALSDTWSFLNGSWTSHAEGSHPSARWSTSMTYDASDGYVLLFGGCSGTDVSDTWKFANDSWTQLSPAHHPSSRGDSQMIYDPHDGYVVLFGGDDYGPIYNDTWTFHAGNWTQLSPLLSPAGRSEGSIAFDSEVGVVVLYGGSGAAGVLGDTWAFSAGNWSPISSAGGPGARAFGIMTDDPADGYVVLFSGAGAVVYQLDDTWALYAINVSASVSVPSAPAPANVTLAANSSDAFATVQYAWAFGDGSFGAGAVVNHTFAAPGLYYVTVSGTDRNGATATAAVEFSATFPFSVVAAVTPLNGTVPYPIALSAQGIGGTSPYTWLWTLPDGSVASTPDVNATLTQVGTFPVTLTATDTSGVRFHREFNVTGVAPTVVPLAVSVVGPR